MRFLFLFPLQVEFPDGNKYNKNSMTFGHICIGLRFDSHACGTQIYCAAKDVPLAVYRTWDAVRVRFQSSLCSILDISRVRYVLKPVGVDRDMLV